MNVVRPFNPVSLRYTLILYSRKHLSLLSTSFLWVSPHPSYKLYIHLFSPPDFIHLQQINTGVRSAKSKGQHSEDFTFKFSLHFYLIHYESVQRVDRQSLMPTLFLLFLV
jgi:hypothetical protein